MLVCGAVKGFALSGRLSVMPSQKMHKMTPVRRTTKLRAKKRSITGGGSGKRKPYPENSKPTEIEKEEITAAEETGGSVDEMTEETDAEISAVTEESMVQSDDVVQSATVAEPLMEEEMERTVHEVVAVEPLHTRIVSSMDWGLVWMGTGITAAIVGAVVVGRSFAIGSSGQGRFLEKIQKVTEISLLLK